jgi:hypothetical protein
LNARARLYGQGGRIVLKKRQLGDDAGTIRRVVSVGESYRDFAGQSGRV